MMEPPNPIGLTLLPLSELDVKQNGIVLFQYMDLVVVV